MTRITAEENPALSDWGAKLHVTLRDGRVLHKDCVYVKGHPKNPFSEADFIAKFKLCVPYSAIALSDDSVEKLMHDVLHLDDVDDVVAALLQPLVPAAA